MGFFEDLKFGQTYEEELIKYLDFDFYNMCVRNKSFKSWDIEIIKDNIKTYYEVKSDRKTFQTGNIAIEYECNKKNQEYTQQKQIIILILLFVKYPMIYILFLLMSLNH